MSHGKTHLGRNILQEHQKTIPYPATAAYPEDQNEESQR